MKTQPNHYTVEVEHNVITHTARYTASGGIVTVFYRATSKSGHMSRGLAAESVAKSLLRAILCEDNYDD